VVKVETIIHHSDTKAEQRLRVLVLLLEPGQFCLVLDEEVELLGTLTLPAHVALHGLGVADWCEGAALEPVEEALEHAASVPEARIALGLLGLARCTRAAPPWRSQHEAR
jgi:hypothetical protein